MSIEKIHRFAPLKQLNNPPLFEVRAAEMPKPCKINESEVSEHFQIYFVEGGKGTYHVDFKKIQVEYAGLFFLSPQQVFRVEAESISASYKICFDKEFYCVETHGKEIACNGLLFNNVHRSTMLALDRKQVALFKGILNDMIVDMDLPNQPAHQAMLETQLRLFLIYALRLADQKKALNETEEDMDESRLVADFIVLLEKYYAQEHRISAYAEMLHIAPKTLTKHLQVHGYTTPKQMLHDRIVLQAKRELRYSDKSIKEIGFDLGFDDPAYFSRFFAKQEGVSAKDYRAGKATASEKRN